VIDAEKEEAGTEGVVLTVPWRRRWLLARRPELAAGVLRIALRRIEAFYCRATGRWRGRSGGVTVVQRFGSAANLNLHFHIVHLDGLFDRGADGALRFFPWAPSTADIEGLVTEIGEACEAWLAREGFAADSEDTPEEEDDVQGVLQLASLTGTHTLGPRARKGVRRVVTFGGKAFDLPPRCASFDGYNLHANVSLAASDRRGLERLCRYVLRPPLSMDRLETLPDGRVRLGLKRVWSDGTTAIELSPLELVERLAALIPPPRVNQIRYHGVLAGNAAWRAEVVPKVPSSSAAEQEARHARRLTKRSGVRVQVRRPGWADLLWRVFQVDGWKCSFCGGAMRLRMIVDVPGAAKRIATGLLRSRDPPVPHPMGDDQGACADA